MLRTKDTQKNAMEEPRSGKHLIAGTNCCFDYDVNEEQERKKRTGLPPRPSIMQMAGALDVTAPSKKTKKKKSKGSIEPPVAPENTTAGRVPPKFSVNGVSLADPGAEYPESRVIKIGPNGAVVVERLENEPPAQAPGTKDKMLRRMVPPVLKIPLALARKILDLDDGRQRFWDELSVQEQRGMFTVSDEDIGEGLLLRQKKLATRNTHADGGPPHDHLWTGNSRFHCTRCEGNDLHMLHIIEEGFDAYMEELMEGLWEQFELQYYELEPHSRFLDIASAEMVLSSKYVEEQNMLRFSEMMRIRDAGPSLGNSMVTVRNAEVAYYIENILLPVIQRDFAIMQKDALFAAAQRQTQDAIFDCTQQILRIIQSSSDRLRLIKHAHAQPLSLEELEKSSVADNLIFCLYNFLKQGMAGIMKSMHFVKILASVGRTDELGVPDVMDQMAKFAESFESNEGRAFVEEVNKLKNCKGGCDTDGSEAHPSGSHCSVRNPFNHCKCDLHSQLSEQFESARHTAIQEGVDSRSHRKNGVDDLYDEDEDEDENDDSHDCSHDHHCHNDDDDEDNDDDDEDEDEDEEGIEYTYEDLETDEEEAEEKRFDELRGFFFMEARRIIVARFNDAYKLHVSEDRTKKFIEELEAEEIAKKEKEQKKLKQREKQKERKRLQQVEKEEKRKQKEAEEMEKAALVRKRQEELRAAQKRREDEIRMKKEQEKMKRIEALRQKERSLAESKVKAERRVSEAQPPGKQKADDTPASVPERRKGKAKEKLKEKEKEEKPVKVSQIKPASTVLEKTGGKVPLEPPSRNPPVVNPPVVNPPVVNPPVVNPPNQKTSERQQGSVTDTTAPETDPAVAFLPAKNHLFEQLYHARPRTVSITSGDKPDYFNEPGTASRMGTRYSPSKNFMLAYQTDPWYPELSLMNPGLERPQFLKTNSIGSAPNTWDAKLSLNPLNAPPMSSSLLMSNLPSSTIWSPNYPSRGNSINSIWGSSPLVSSDPNVPSSTLWAPQTAQNEPTNIAAPSNSSSSSTSTVNNKELVQSAAFKAIKEAEAARETQEGVSSAMRIFQAARTILNNPHLKMSEFLLLLHSNTKYHFEIVYDDRGSVTDIKASLQPERIFGTPSVTNTGSPSPRQAHVQPMYHAQPPPFTQMDHGLNFAGIAPASMSMNPPRSQPINQGMSQPGLGQDQFRTASGGFHPSVSLNSQFPPTTGTTSSQPVPGADIPVFPSGSHGNHGNQVNQGSFRGSGENATQQQHDAKISETMQGSLNQLGIGKVRSGIW